VGNGVRHHLTGKISKDGERVETWCGLWLAVEDAGHTWDAVDCKDCMAVIRRTPGTRTFVVGGPGGRTL
jgi:hypothetical protein